jgi:hypothetical protein
MTLLDLFQLPEYEVPENGCDVQVRWPGLVAAARSSSPTSKHRSFYEFAPLPGGFFLGGVGHERADSDEPPFLREQILGHLLAGHDLGESVCNALREPNHGEVCYVLFDPVETTLRIFGCGPTVSAIHIAAGIPRLVQLGLEVGHESPRPLILRPEEALLLVAHRAWAKYVLTAVDKSLPKGLYGFGESEALRLCGLMETMLGARGSSSLVVYRSASAAICPDNRPSGQKDPPMTLEQPDTSLTMSDLEFLDELAGGLAR